MRVGTRAVLEVGMVATAGTLAEAEPAAASLEAKVIEGARWVAEAHGVALVVGVRG